MANAASHRWENGVLVERAIETNRGNAGGREEVEATATKPYKAPLRTPRSTEDREAYAKERAQAEGTEDEDRPSAKAVLEAENKAVASAETKKPRKRAAKK